MAAEAQAEIGRRALYLGFLSKKWRTVLVRIDTTPNKLNWRRWLKELAKKLLQTSWDIWDFRNAIKHSDKAVQYNRELERVREEVRRELSRGTNELRPEDRYRIENKEVDWLRQPLVQTQQWLSSVTAARNRWRLLEDNQRQSDGASRRVMEEWLSGRQQEERRDGEGERA